MDDDDREHVRELLARGWDLFARGRELLARGEIDEARRVGDQIEDVLNRAEQIVLASNEGAIVAGRMLADEVEHWLAAAQS